ncbi:hypothetical protein GGX14DRAFT_573465 [Mycena pura]|uniref:F-box domain-containing protein n=1 Tax=Mycena pura TaxID=153505 RepID=A0AAD6YA23_9AGAR|nr:hypothetical protein GGX14DRAFT_573465 [Mycena pura]
MLIEENTRPTEAQERRIRDAIPHLQKDVREIEAEFNEVDISLAIIPPNVKPDARLTRQLAALKLRLDSAQDKLAAHQRSITFARQVPVEVLEVIFFFCMPPDFVRPDARQAPLLLCQICSAWRRVAIATPRLWTSLALNLGRRRGAWRDFLAAWLGRSANCPIVISFTGDHHGGVYQYFNEHVVQILRPYARRWRRLRVDVPQTSLTKLLNAPLPLLETLEIRTRTGTAGSVFVSAADAPRLRRLVLIETETRPTTMCLPWDRLTEFHAPKYALDPDKCFPLLAKCTSLTRCTILLSLASATATSLPYRPLKMARLRTLIVLGAISRDTVQSFFTQIVLPKLNRLELVNLREGESFALGEESSLAVLARESNLRSLFLLGGNPEIGLFQTVAAIPSLRQVVVGNMKGDLKWVPQDIRNALEMRDSNTG